MSALAFLSPLSHSIPGFLVAPCGKLTSLFSLMMSPSLQQHLPSHLLHFRHCRPGPRPRWSQPRNCSLLESPSSGPVRTIAVLHPQCLTPSFPPHPSFTFLETPRAVKSSFSPMQPLLDPRQLFSIFPSCLKVQIT